MSVNTLPSKQYNSHCNIALFSWTQHRTNILLFIHNHIYMHQASALPETVGHMELSMYLLRKHFWMCCVYVMFVECCRSNTESTNFRIDATTEWPLFGRFQLNWLISLACALCEQWLRFLWTGPNLIPSQLFGNVVARTILFCLIYLISIDPFSIKMTFSKNINSPNCQRFRDFLVT